MKTFPAPSVGALGFYGPNPGGPRSPNMVREVRGSIIEVREIVTGNVSELTADEWWSARAMCADTDRLVNDGNFDRIDLAARIRAMNTALACYARVFPEKPVKSLDGATQTTATKPELVAACDEDEGVSSRELGSVSLQQFADDFLMLPPLHANPTASHDSHELTPLSILDAGGGGSVLGEMSFSLPELKTDSRRAQVA